MDKNKVYCRYCGKLIDEDASFCTYCGKQQKANDDKKTSLMKIAQKPWAQVSKEALGSVVNNMCKKIKPGHKTIKKVVISAIAIFGTCLVVFFADWIYGVYVISQFEEQVREQERIAMTDISKADDIARDLFKKCYKGEHYNYKGLFIWHSCKINHMEVAQKIIRNAAEKGNADAQFTLGTIYAGAEYRTEKPYFMGESTMFGDKINYSHAAYWYNKAAEQGHLKAMYNLGNAYRKGTGVEQNFLKATQLISKAAEQGENRAQLAFGDMYREGEVFIYATTDSITGDSYYIHPEPNIRLAKIWWKKAAESNDEDIRDEAEKRFGENL